MKTRYHSHIEQSSDFSGPPTGAVGGGKKVTKAQRLVSSSISQRNRLVAVETGRLVGFEKFPRALRIVRESFPLKKTTVPLRGSIDSFSDKSRARLRFVAGNTSVPLVSQFGLTYHRRSPSGRLCKSHLNAFLTALRRRWSGVHYLWILEFQTRGVPHYHLFLSLNHNATDLHQWLAETWHRIAEPDSPEHLRFHLHKNNFIPWVMDKPGYLTKYLEKQNQKLVPDGFEGCGRFWGHSRGLVAIPELFSLSTIRKLDWIYPPQHLSSYSEDLSSIESWIHKVPSKCYIDDDCFVNYTLDAETFIIRTIRRWHDSKLKRFRKRSRVSRTPYNMLLQNGGPIFGQIVKYLVDYAPETLPF